MMSFSRDPNGSTRGIALHRWQTLSAGQASPSAGHSNMISPRSACLTSEKRVPAALSSVLRKVSTASCTSTSWIEWGLNGRSVAEAHPSSDPGPSCGARLTLTTDELVDVLSRPELWPPGGRSSIRSNNSSAAYLPVVVATADLPDDAGGGQVRRIDRRSNIRLTVVKLTRPIWEVSGRAHPAGPLVYYLSI